MKKSPKVTLKILQGSYRIANENGILTEFIFYHQLKRLRIDGFFARGTIKNYFDALPYKEVTIRSKITRMIELGFIRKENGGYQLISYDDLWKLLGYDLRDPSKYRIIRVNSDTEFKWELMTLEIDKNIRSQERIAIKGHIYKECDLNPDTDKIPKKLIKAMARKFSHKIALRKQLLEIRRTLSYAKVNYDFTLSCEGVAKLFGYTSGAQGWQIEKELKRRNLLKVMKRPPLFISSDISELVFYAIVDEQPNHPILSRCFMTNDGVVFLRRANLLELNPDHFNRFFNELNTPIRGGLVKRTSIEEIQKEKEWKKGEKGKKYTCESNIGGVSNIVSKRENSFYINPLTLKETKLY